MGKSHSDIISGWLWAIWKDKFYKIGARFLSTFSVWELGAFLFFNPVHEIIKPSLHLFEFILAYNLETIQIKHAHSACCETRKKNWWVLRALELLFLQVPSASPIGDRKATNRPLPYVWTPPPRPAWGQPVRPGCIQIGLSQCQEHLKWAEQRQHKAQVLTAPPSEVKGRVSKAYFQLGSRGISFWQYGEFQNHLWYEGRATPWLVPVTTTWPSHLTHRCCHAKFHIEYQGVIVCAGLHVGRPFFRRHNLDKSCILLDSCMLSCDTH